MKRSTGPRKTAKLSKSLHRQLNSYALAASAAGVGALALSVPAEAKIVYTQTHHVIGTNGVYRLDLNHDGITDFVIRQSGSTLGSTGTNALLVNGDAVVGHESVHTPHVPAALRKGAVVGTNQSFIPRRYHESTMVSVWQTDSIGLHDYGKWVNITNRYLGLRFKIAGETHYGWARLSVRVKGRKITATLTGYAYETIPNKPIIAGKTKGPDVITVQPGSLGYLAHGASAIPAWRMKQNTAPTQ